MKPEFLMPNSNHKLSLLYKYQKSFGDKKSLPLRSTRELLKCLNNSYAMPKL